MNEKLYLIPIKKFQGKQLEFFYEIGNNFYDTFIYDDIYEMNFKVHLRMTKVKNFFELNFDISGTIKTRCDRCYEIIHLPIKNFYTFFIELTDKIKENEAYEITLTPDTEEYNIKPILYDITLLSIPAKRIHDETQYPECLNFLNKYTSNKKNYLGEKFLDIFEKILNENKN